MRLSNICEEGQDGDGAGRCARSEEHTSELQSQSNLVCRLLLEKKKKVQYTPFSYKPFTPFNLLRYSTLQEQQRLTNLCHRHCINRRCDVDKHHHYNS